MPSSYNLQVELPPLVDDVDFFVWQRWNEIRHRLDGALMQARAGEVNGGGASYGGSAGEAGRLTGLLIWIDVEELLEAITITRRVLREEDVPDDVTIEVREWRGAGFKRTQREVACFRLSDDEAWMAFDPGSSA